MPGAFEIPAAIALAARGGEHGGKSFDGYVALGCVIRGETSHYEMSRRMRARPDGSGHQQRPGIGNGILTVENEEQALARAAVDDGDKGGDAARACLALVDIAQPLSACTDERSRRHA